MRDLIKKNLDGRKVLFLFIIANVIYTIMLTITIPELMNYSGGMKIMDMMPTGYNADYVNALLIRLGEQGRHAYLFHQIPVDMIYPVFFGVSNCLVIAYFLNKLGKLDSPLFFLYFLPLFAGLFDYFENAGIIAMLKTFPNNPVLLSQTTNVFSVLKSGFTTLYFIVLIITLIVSGKSSLFRKAK